MSGLLREKFAVGKVPELRAAYSSSEKAPWLGLALPETGKNPYQTLLHASPEDVRLVMVGGIATYGDPDLMSQLLPKRQLETLTVCGTTKALYIEPQEAFPKRRSPSSRCPRNLMRSWHNGEPLSLNSHLVTF